MPASPETPPQLIAQKLQQDPRVAHAKELLLAALEEKQREITGIRPPLEGLKEGYEQLLKKFAAIRGAPLWHPYIGSGIGKGALVELADGSIKYDFISGIGVHYWGHNHPALLVSGIDAALSNTVMQGNLQQNLDAVELSELLLKHSGFDHCFLTTSGAMANENALKIAFQKKYPANRILAFEKSFAGRSLALSQITDKPAFREGLPINLFVDYLPFFDPAAPEESTMRTLKALHQLLRRYPKQHALICFELVQGEAGYFSAPKQFFESIMQVAKEEQIAILSDEVQCFGRTTELFAFQHFGLASYVDLVTIGKLSQVCATLFTQEYTPRPGLLSQTFIGSSAALKAAKVIIEGLLNGGYFGSKGKIATLSSRFMSQLQQFSIKNPHLMQGPFGVGAMIAFTPFNGEAEQAAQFVHRLFDAGVISFIAGTHPTRVRFLMPVGAIGFEEIDQVVQLIQNCLE
jgi:4-aminobutyrate aminotransferase-like enzyme